MTILLDKWFDGDPSNNDYFKTKFEHDADETQLRFGGDIKGLTNNRTLDYLYGMGIRAIYIAGTPWLNMPWQADSKAQRVGCERTSSNVLLLS
jgi:alpha-1,3-glucan synthase